jgi:hypothetical protein
MNKSDKKILAQLFVDWDQKFTRCGQYYIYGERPSRNPNSAEYHIRGEMIRDMICTMTQLRGADPFDPEEQEKTILEAYRNAGTRRPPWMGGVPTHRQYPEARR